MGHVVRVGSVGAERSEAAAAFEEEIVGREERERSVGSPLLVVLVFRGRVRAEVEVIVLMELFRVREMVVVEVR